MININVDIALTQFNSKKTWTDQNVINSKSFNSEIKGVVVIISKATSLWSMHKQRGVPLGTARRQCTHH